MAEFSVIVPVYKVEIYIGRCIESILRQTFSDFELILVDDGSPDNSGVICDEYAKKDSRIRVIHKPNGGVSSARNAGLDAACGRYVVFADSDDEVEPGYLECMRSFTSDLVIAGVQRVEPDGTAASALGYHCRQVSPISSEKIVEMVHNSSLNYVYAKRYDTNIIRTNQLRFREDISLGEDTLFVAEYLCHCNAIQYVYDTPYKYYRYEAATLSGFDCNYVEKLIRANTLIAKVLDTRFVGISTSDPWKRRCWSIFHYSIFHVLRDANTPLTQKHSMLKKYFAMPEYRVFSRSLDTYMAEDAVFWRRLLSTCNAALVVLGWKIVSVTEKLKGANR